MIKKTFFTICFMAFSLALFAQSKKKSVNQSHKVVFHLSSDDTLVHKALMKQLNNVLVAAPGSTLEVICHGPGIEMLMRDKTLVLDKIQQFKTRGVTFEACENTLKDKNMSKDKIIAEAGFVPSALIHLVSRQEEGWSYIKSGF